LNAALETYRGLHHEPWIVLRTASPAARPGD
jgi:hypothetical protein